MATFNLGSGTELNNLDDISKVKSYLFQLTEQLRYMFSNLTPEDNYSEQARLTYVTDGERQSSIEVSLDHINLQMVNKDEVVSAINMSKEQIKILAEKIALEGLVTVNSNFQIGLDGSITARNGNFSGDITASAITGSTITGSTFQLNRGANVGFVADGETFQLGDFIVNDWWGRQVLESTDEVTGMSGEPEEEGGLFLWAGYYDEDDYRFVVNSGGAYVMYGGEAYNIGETLSRLSNMAYYDGEDPDDDPDPNEQDDDWDGSSPDGKPDPGYIDSGPGVGL